VIWPLEGLPSGVRWVSNLMPITYAVFAVKGVVSKGVSCYLVVWKHYAMDL